MRLFPAAYSFALAKINGPWKEMTDPSLDVSVGSALFTYGPYGSL